MVLFEQQRANETDDGVVVRESMYRMRDISMIKSPSQNDAFKQGDFDGLCGVYSILNAVNIVVPETSRSLHRVYFARLLAHIVRSMNPTSIVRGLGPRQMWSLIDRTRGLVQSQ